MLKKYVLKQICAKIAKLEHKITSSEESESALRRVSTISLRKDKTCPEFDQYIKKTIRDLISSKKET